MTKVNDSQNPEPFNQPLLQVLSHQVVQCAEVEVSSFTPGSESDIDGSVPILTNMYLNV